MKNLIALFTILTFACNKPESKHAELIEQRVTQPFENSPSLFLGGDFMHFFQSHFKQSNLKVMLDFTSSQSRKIFGDKKILSYYNKIDFGYSFKLKSMRRQGRTYNLSYEAQINATSRVVRFQVIKEEENYKLILPNITDKIFGFVTPIK